MNGCDGHPAPRRVTLRDVARHASVSRATASLVLRGSPLVAAPTRERVLGVMNDLGYVYHRGAASLRTQRSRTVGLIVPDVANPFFAELTLGVETELDAANHLVLLGNTAEAIDKQQRLLAAAREYNADGILCCPAVGTAPETIDGLRRQRLPVVLFVRYLPGLQVDYVGADNVLGAELGTAHLIALGHRRIAFVGGAETSSARADRLCGYRTALARHDLPLDDALCVTSAPTRDGGYSAIRALLARRDPPSAALCYNDVVAFGVVLGARAAGLTVGRDLAVVGFDDIAEAALWRPALTTLASAPRHLGAVAARLLLDRIADPNGVPRRVILTPTLVVRESCGAPARQESLP